MRLVAPYVVVSSIVLLLHRRHLDVFRVGDDEAATLGVSVGRTRFVIVIAATLGTAAVVAVSGLIGFVGLVIPHVVRLIAGARNRRVLPLSLMGGAGFLVLADVPGRMLANPAETPIGVVTAFIGAPFFIYLFGRGGSAHDRARTSTTSPSPTASARPSSRSPRRCSRGSGSG